MNVLSDGFDIEGFWKKLTVADRRVLLLDYDGTLAPFRKRRDQAVPYKGVREILEGIMNSGVCRLVIVSGRWTEDLKPLLGIKKLPEVWGSHGIERLRPDGSREIAAFSKSALKGIADADDWVEHMGLHHMMEQKPGCIALHWRGMDREKIKELKRMVKKDWSKIAERAGLDILEFDGGVELRVPGHDKGKAVETILAEEGDAAVAYLGDDVTDEDAFRAVKGKGMGVLVRKELRKTSADVWIKPPEELMKFLKKWTMICGV